MNAEPEIKYPQQERWAYLWLIVGAILLTLSTGQFRLAFAAWLAPVFLIRFFRSQRTGKGYAILLPVLYVAYAVSWRTVLEFIGPLPVFLIFNIMVAVMNSFPYLLDRLLAPRLKGFAGTLVYPLAVTSIFYLYNLASPIGSFGTPGYEQYNNLALIQLVSVIGLWGLTLLVSWCGPVINWAWELSFNWPQTRRGLAVFGGVVALVLAFGGLRLALAQLPAGAVHVHGLSVVDVQDVDVPDLNADLTDFRRATQAGGEAFITATIREARRGAQIVLWPEGAVRGVEEDTSALIARGQEVARQEGIYIAMGLWIYFPGQDHPWENKMIVIAPSGEIVIDHDKFGATFLYSLMGAGEALQGEYRVRTVDTPYGTLAGVVCWDGDFPMTMRQAGQQKTDIVLVGTGDPGGPVAVLHAQQHIFRAIENGVSLVRHDNRAGWSVAADPYGRVLAALDLSTASEPVMVAQVPTQGIFTLYPIIGDVFGWLPLVGLVALIAWVFARRLMGK